MSKLNIKTSFNSLDIKDENWYSIKVVGDTRQQLTILFIIVCVDFYF